MTVGSSWTLANGASADVYLNGTVAGGVTYVYTTASVDNSLNNPNTSGDNYASASSNNVSGTADLSTTNLNQANNTNYVPGSVVSHQMTVTNSATSIADVVSARFDFSFVPTSGSFTNISWTCTPSGGSACGAASGTVPNGGTAFTTTVSVPIGKSVTFTWTATTSATKNGDIVTTALITPPSGIKDAVNTTNNTATLTDHDTADLALAMITSTTGTSANGQYLPPTTIIYTSTITNGGPNDVTGASLNNAMASSATSASWTCTASSGSTCPTGTNPGTITGNITTANSIFNIKSGGTVTFAFTVSMPAGATASQTNTATVFVPSLMYDGTPANNMATITDTLKSKPLAPIVNWQIRVCTATTKRTDKFRFKKYTDTRAATYWLYTDATTAPTGPWNVTSVLVKSGVAPYGAGYWGFATGTLNIPKAGHKGVNWWLEIRDSTGTLIVDSTKVKC